MLGSQRDLRPWHGVWPVLLLLAGWAPLRSWRCAAAIFITLLGTTAEHSQAAQIALDSTSPEAHVRPSDVVECPPMQRGGQQPPLLRVWFVASPESRSVPAVDAATVERLRALGYKW